MKSNVTRALLVGAVLAATACGGTARNSAKYSADTQALLESRADQIKSCYNDALKADPKTAGTVTIHFEVEKKTGAVSNAAVDAEKSTAPAALGQCVVNGVSGLVLSPGDKDLGKATFVYDFEPSGVTMPAAASPAAS